MRPVICGLLSFYSSWSANQALATAKDERDFLNLTETGAWRGPGREEDRGAALKDLTRRRRNHQLNSVTESEAVMMNKAMERVLLRITQGSGGGSRECSGIDWRSLIDEIVQRYYSSLIELLNVLTAAKGSPGRINHIASQTRLAAVRDLTHGFLLPFFEYPSSPDNASGLGNIWSLSSPLAQITYSRYRYHHTRLLAPEEGIFLNPEEAALKLAVEETLGGICSAIIDLGFSVEREWSRGLNTEVDARIDIPWKVSLKIEEVRWKRKTEELMAWLGWAAD